MPGASVTEVAAAETLILSNIPRLTIERLALAECVGRVLREDVFAERPQPPFDRVTMDGIALAHRDWASGMRAFEITGTQAAGTPQLAVERVGQCVEVMTGAMLPAGTDTVVPVERIERAGRVAAVSAPAVERGQFVHAAGGDRTAGTVLLTAGTRIGAPESAVLASSGQATFAVARLPHAAVISTGDELVDAGQPIAPYQIRSSNDYAIEASLTAQRLATVTRARLADDAAALAGAIAELHDRTDLLILSGGVSMGKFDFVPAVLERLGAKVVFHRIQQKPGRPMWFGMSAQRKPIFALPGNPVSTLVCATRYILPALRSAAGLGPAPPEYVTLAAQAQASAELTYFLPVKLTWSTAGAALAEPRPTNTSGDFVSLAGTDGFVQLAARREPYPAGTAARLFRW
jgi:molybdopterin molybdotransferase